MQQVSPFFYWWLMTKRKLQRFWTPFLSVNSFQLLWKTCVRWCAWNRVFVSIATLQLLLRLALAVAILLRNDEPKASFGIDDTRGDAPCFGTTREFELKFPGWFLLARQTLLACLWKTERYFMTRAKNLKRD